MRMARVAVVILAALSVPVLAQDKNSCLNAKNHNQAIKSCSEVIRSHPTDAVAYHMRGNALAKNGDLGQAIADYGKAIQLNPTYAPAYNSRATTFVSKGDYTRAVADVTKAGELAQQVKTKAPIRAKPKMKNWASAKVKDKKEEAAFNPFADGASPQ